MQNQNRISPFVICDACKYIGYSSGFGNYGTGTLVVMNGQSDFCPDCQRPMRVINGAYSRFGNEIYDEIFSILHNFTQGDLLKLRQVLIKAQNERITTPRVLIRWIKRENIGGKNNKWFLTVLRFLFAYLLLQVPDAVNNLLGLIHYINPEYGVSLSQDKESIFGSKDKTPPSNSNNHKGSKVSTIST